MDTPPTMHEDSQQLRDLLHTRVLHMNAVVMSIVVGLVMGVGLFAVTNFLLLRDGRGAGPHLSLLGQLLIGYRVTFVGSLIGFAWAFAGGFLATYMGATLYNWLADYRARRSSAAALGAARQAPGPTRTANEP